MRSRLRRSLLLPTLALTLVLAGCGSSDSDSDPGGGDDVVAPDTTSGPGDDVAAVDDTAAPDDVAAENDVPSEPEPVLSFTPAEGESEDGAVWMTVESGATDDEVVVHLWAGHFPDVLGWAFDLRYHPGILTLSDVALHDVLTARTWEGRCVAKERGPGRLNVGCARFLVGQDMFAVAEYSGPLDDSAEFATLRFHVEDTGASGLEFDPARRLARSGDEPSLPIAWRGGELTINRLPQATSETGEEGR